MFKGKKMAGHMGDERVTVQNLDVVSTDVERGLILVRGGVPGSEGGWVEVRDAVKRAAPEGLPFPGSVRTASVDETVTEEAVAEEAAPAEEIVSENAPAEDAPADDAEKKDDSE